MAIAKINEIKPAHIRVVNATCSRYNYQETAPDGTPNPETRVAFTERIWDEQMIRLVKQTERMQAQRELDKTNPVADLNV